MVEHVEKPLRKISVSEKTVKDKVKRPASQARKIATANLAVAVFSGKLLVDCVKGIRTSSAKDGRKAIELLVGDLRAIAETKTLPALMRLHGEQSARRLESASDIIAKTSAEIREVVVEQVAPMVAARIKANMACGRKA